VTALLQIRRDAVGELIHKHQTPLSKVASHLGLTPSRISQLAQAALRALEGRDAR
jgi:DNA-directed RNA polymerase specialized sigma subunit